MALSVPKAGLTESADIGGIASVRGKGSGKMRVIFFAGKGGVGKTSVAAATGVKAAEMGHKTVVMSLDPGRYYRPRWERFFRRLP